MQLIPMEFKNVRIAISHDQGFSRDQQSLDNSARTELRYWHGSKTLMASVIDRANGRVASRDFLPRC